MTKKELALKHKRISQYKNIIANINIMIIDDNLPLTVSLIPSEKHSDYEHLKAFVKPRKIYLNTNQSSGNSDS